jgi:hypothetical protein
MIYSLSNDAKHLKCKSTNILKEKTTGYNLGSIFCPHQYFSLRPVVLFGVFSRGLS